MYGQCVIAEYHNLEDARNGLVLMANSGFGEDRLSFISRSDSPELRRLGALEEGGETPSETSTGAGIGALLAGAISVPVAASTLIGPFILFGPLVAAGIGTAVGGLLGGAQDWGLNEEAGKTYEQRVRDGAILILVVGDDFELREAEATLKTTGPTSLTRFARPE